MFDNFRERIRKLEETNETFRNTKKHVEKHKVAYAAGGAAIGAGAIFGFAGYSLGVRSAPDVIQTFVNSTDNVGTVINKSKNVDVVIKYLNARNYNANPVRCLETLQEFPSQEEAAEAFQMAATILSKHLNGKFPDAKGFHFERI